MDERLLQKMVIEAAMPLSDLRHSRLCKRRAVTLVVIEGYTHRKAAEAVSASFGARIDDKTVTRWVAGFETRILAAMDAKRKGFPKDGDEALMTEIENDLLMDEDEKE